MPSISSATGVGTGELRADLSWRGARLTIVTERLRANASSALFTSCFFQDCIWFECTSKRSASLGQRVHGASLAQPQAGKVYRRTYETVAEAKKTIADYLCYFNEASHQGLDN